MSMKVRREKGKETMWKENVWEGDCSERRYAGPAPRPLLHRLNRCLLEGRRPKGKGSYCLSVHMLVGTHPPGHLKHSIMLPTLCPPPIQMEEVTQ